MKIYITYDSQSRIKTITSLTFYIRKGKSEEECEAAIQQRNKEAGWKRFSMIEVPEQMEEIIDFLLGENQYKFYNDITDVSDELSDITGNMIEVHAGLKNVSQCLEDIRNKLENFKEK